MYPFYLFLNYWILHDFFQIFLWNNNDNSIEIYLHLIFGNRAFIWSNNRLHIHLSQHDTYLNRCHNAFTHTNVTRNFFNLSKLTYFKFYPKHRSFSFYRQSWMYEYSNIKTVYPTNHHQLYIRYKVWTRLKFNKFQYQIDEHKGITAHSKKSLPNPTFSAIRVYFLDAHLNLKK